MDSIAVEVQQNGTAPGIVGSGVDTNYYVDDHPGTAQMELRVVPPGTLVQLRTCLLNRL